MQMNFPGSSIGACRRAEDAGTVTHSLIPAIPSSAAGPPSMNARALCGTRAAAISAARLAPLANAQQPAPPPPGQPIEMKQESHAAENAAYNIGAGVANVFYVPGKAALCGLGGIVGIFVMLVSVGSAPKTAAGFAREGCGGKWILTGEDLRPDAEARTFDWEKDRSY